VSYQLGDDLIIATSSWKLGPFRAEIQCEKQAMPIKTFPFDTFIPSARFPPLRNDLTDWLNIVMSTFIYGLPN